MATSIAPAHPPVEHVLEDLGIEYSLENLDLSQINVRLSEENNARVQAFDLKVVGQYASCMERGDAFPPIVVGVVEGQKVILDGNHRFRAARSIKRESFPAYVIDDLGVEIRNVLLARLNGMNGMPPSEEEKLMHAQHLYKTMGLSMEAAAKAACIPTARLQQAIHAETATIRAREMRITNFAKLAPSIRHRLGRIRNDKAFKDLSKLAIEASLNQPELDALVRDVNELGSESAQVALIASRKAEMKQRIEQVAAGSFRRTNRGRSSVVQNHWFHISGHVAGIKNLNANRLLDELEPRQRKELSQQMLAAAEKLLATAVILEK